MIQNLIQNYLNRACSRKIFLKRLFLINEFLNTNNLLSNIQSGFRRLHSLPCVILHMIGTLIWQWFNKYNFYLKKAFDAIDHDILLQKSTCYGFNNKTIWPLQNYLTDRTQLTLVVNNIRSDICKVTCGVPKGSSPGPLLYMYIYIWPLNSLILKLNVCL